MFVCLFSFFRILLVKEPKGSELPGGTPTRFLFLVGRFWRKDLNLFNLNI